jgi:hypothetical protein
MYQYSQNSLHFFFFVYFDKKESRLLLMRFSLDKYAKFKISIQIKWYIPSVTLSEYLKVLYLMFVFNCLLSVSICA